MPEARQLLADALERGDYGDSVTEKLNDSIETEENILDTIRQQNGALAEQIDIAQNPNSSDEDVIRALQAIDDEVSTTGDREVYNELKGIRDAVQEDRGIKKYDPFEGASKDPAADMLKLGQSIVGLYNTIKGGLDALTTTTGMLVRGISNTKELGQLVDGFQSMASAVGSVVSTVGEIINVVASMAALAGAAIPGVGQVGAVVAGITGGISAVNGVIDLIQEVMSIGGMFLGGFLSAIAGGPDGALRGNIRILLDTNDNTIKTWSDDDPNDKRVHRLPGSGLGNESRTVGVETLNQYMGPGRDPDEVLRGVNFAVRTGMTGAYAQ
jgi:hypothetical protein